MNSREDAAGSFDVLRLLAALMVFHGHHYPLSGYAEPRAAFFPGFGYVAVSVFFALSGFVITKSALRRSLAEFVTARFLRIYPALAASVILTTLVGAKLTSLPWHDYWSNPQTLKFLGNIAIFFNPAELSLPGVFDRGANTVANGSLWTLPYEILFYLVIGGAALFGRRGVLMAAGLFAIIALNLTFNPPANRVLSLWHHFDLAWLPLWAFAFFTGVGLSFVDRTRLPRILMLTTALFALAYRDPRIGLAAASIFYGSWAVYAGLALSGDRLLRKMDLSYGIYIYAFPCQQVAIRLFDKTTAGFVASYLIALAATIALAWLSWRFIERPIMANREMLMLRVARFTKALAARPSEPAAR